MIGAIDGATRSLHPPSSTNFETDSGCCEPKMDTAAPKKIKHTRPFEHHGKNHADGTKHEDPKRDADISASGSNGRDESAEKLRHVVVNGWRATMRARNDDL